MRDVDLPDIELHESVTGERILPGEPHDEPGDPDQPPGITSDSRRLPPLNEAAERVGAFLSDWGDGRIDDGTDTQPPLFARDLEVLRKHAAEVAADHELGCADCGLRYGAPGWVDASIPDADWLAISPTDGPGGVLCITCMAKRLTAAGRRNVPVLIDSGPFTSEPAYWWGRGIERGREFERTRIRAGATS